MSEITEAERHYIEDQLLEAAMTIDRAQHSAALRKGEVTFELAGNTIRRYRRGVIEQTSDRDNIVRALKNLNDELSNFGGRAEEAVSNARRIVADAHYRLASSRERQA
jgi:hypothetical protein